MSTQETMGTLYPDKQQNIDLIKSKNKVWNVFEFDGIHIGRIELATTDQAGVQRLSNGSLLLTTVLFDKNDSEALTDTARITLHEFLRNDMTQAFFDVDRVIPKPTISEYQTRNALYWTVEFALEGVDALEDETLTLTATVVVK